jgi:hypothetical protein
MKSDETGFLVDPIQKDGDVTDANKNLWVFPDKIKIQVREAGLGVSLLGAHDSPEMWDQQTCVNISGFFLWRGAMLPCC